MAEEQINAQAGASALVASDRVEGTAVYGPDNHRIGRIERLMIDKASGKVAYAVLTFGGFLGIGEDHYPLPWAKLDYDTKLDGYRVDLTEDQLRAAPKFGRTIIGIGPVVTSRCTSITGSTRSGTSAPRFRRSGYIAAFSDTNFGNKRDVTGGAVGARTPRSTR